MVGENKAVFGGDFVLLTLLARQEYEWPRPREKNSTMTQNAEVLHIQEGNIALPEGFEDRTANVFVPANTETSPNLSIARDRLNAGEELSAYVTRQVALLKSRIPGHKVTRRGPARLGAEDGALDGEQIDAEYKNSGRTVYQRQAAFLIAPQRALIFSAASPVPLNEAFDSLWLGWLASFHDRDKST